MRRPLILLVVASFFTTLISCTQGGSDQPATILYEDHKPIAISLPRTIADLSDDSIRQYIQLRVYKATSPVLTTTTVTNNRILLTSSVPMERGQSYDVIYAPTDSILMSFDIPLDKDSKTPEVKNVENLCGHVPSNLLKVYVVFSEPMSQGRSYSYIHLFNETASDTVDNAFLDLQPELWSDDGLVLTLWLDPGRIKKDLIPNKELGTVLDDGEKYSLTISKGWKSQKNVPTDKVFRQVFSTATRDIEKPVVSKWKVKSPVSSNDSLVIELNEALDWALLGSTVTIEKDSEVIDGVFHSRECNRLLSFMPKNEWSSGEYTIHVSSTLEDRAGNNLNRLFETDVTLHETIPDKPEYTISFHVR